jgi:hypothetical protein
MQYEGVIKKMKSEFSDPVQYYLLFEKDFVHVNQLLDKEIELNFLGYKCLGCHEDKTIFRQGFCYDCFYQSPQAGDWIIRPELSTAHLNKQDRDLEYEKKIQLQPHVVYLANSSNVKVGVTRKLQIPTRWIDQGAHEAMEIAETPNRYLAGLAEVALKAHISDKTSWRKMLLNHIEPDDLAEARSRLAEHIPEEVKPYFLENNKSTLLNFPVLKYPQKPKVLNFPKTQNYSGVLKGIKGQYLIFEDDVVFNVRRHEGFVVGLKVGA